MSFRDLLGDDSDLPWVDATDGEFGDGDPFFDDSLSSPPRQERLWPSKVERPDTREIQLAKQVLADKGRVVFNKIAETKDGEVWEAKRRNTDVKLGTIEFKVKEWKFTPLFNMALNIIELDEISDFMDELL